MVISAKNKAVTLFLRLIVVVSAALGVCLSAYAAGETFMGGSRVFMFFTIQSNIAIALISLVGAVLLLSGTKPGGAWAVIHFVGTVSITLTGAVFTFILAPTLGRGAWNLQNILTHVVVPAAAILDFLTVGACYDIRKRNVFWVTLPPAAYAVYAAVGYAAGWKFTEHTNYPYFFLNWGSPAGAFGFSRELPYMGCAWWILALLALLLAVGCLYLLITDRIRKRRKTGR